MPLSFLSGSSRFPLRDEAGPGSVTGRLTQNLLTRHRLSYWGILNHRNEPRRMVQDRGIFLSIMPATQGERRLALAVLAVSLGIFAICIPFAKLPLAHIDAFIPAYQSAVT